MWLPHTVVSTLKLPVISCKMAQITILSPCPKTLLRSLRETSAVVQVKEPPPPPTSNTYQYSKMPFQALFLWPSWLHGKTVRLA